MDKQKNIIKEISKYKGIIFDLDGTLIDLNVDWERLKEDLSVFCFKIKGEKINFTPLDKKLIFVKKKYGKVFYLKLLNIIYKYESKWSKYKINKPLIDYINDPANKNQRLAIYSMNTEKCINDIIIKYLKRKPSIIISKNNCLEPKPTKKDLQKILCNWKLEKKSAIFIGDSRNDLESGKKIGIKTIII